MNVSSYPPPPPSQTPLPAPKPHKIDQQMAHTLENFGNVGTPPLPAPPQMPNPGFAGGFNPGGLGPGPGPGRAPTPGYNSNSSSWSPWAGATPAPTMSTPKPMTPPAQNPGQLTLPLPTIPALLPLLSSIHGSPPQTQIQWIRDVLFLVDKSAATTAALASVYPNTSASDPPSGPVTIDDAQLAQLAQVAVPLLLQFASQTPPLPEAVYHRACLTSSGAFPEFVKTNPRQAFRDFESSARAGHYAAWFRIGRDYEGFGDAVHARECFERGVKYGVASCLYRMGMAYLLGQLGVSQNVEKALGMLKAAAVGSTIEAPQPGYVYALLLLGEFAQYTVPPHMWSPLLPPHHAHLPGNQGVLKEAKTHLERSAFLHFAPAQYKLGHAYEFAVPPWEFDALMSVEWYSRASQQGEVEADMALSKWFLCGSGTEETHGAVGGGFEKDESLARVFAEKAARRGLPSAEFAMGYYLEVGVGGPKDVQASISWYGKAADHGNSDAADRLKALQGGVGALSRAEHDTITESKLVRSRTQARERSEAQKLRDGWIKGNMPNTQQQQAPPPSMSGFPSHNSQPSYSSPQPPAFTGSPQPPFPGSPQPHQHNPHPNPQHPGQQHYRQGSQQVVELIRKNTLGSSGPSGSSGRGGAPGPHGRYNTEPPHQNTLPGAGQHFPGANRYALTDPGSGSGSPRPPQGGFNSPRPDSAYGGGGRPVDGGYGSPRPGTAGSRPNTAGGSRPGSAGGRPPQGAGFPPQQQQQGPGSGFGGAGGAPKPAKPGPQTFADMGIQGAKAEDKECVIM